MPQEGIYRCQYCGYILSKNVKNIKKTINRLKDIIGTLNKDQIFATMKLKFTGDAGTRSGTDRRKYQHMHYFPERRSGKDRRKKVERNGQFARKRF